MNKISIIDYGIGNILSVKRAFEHQGAEVEFVDKPEQISKADHLVLPGVGAFRDGMKELESRNLVTAIQQYCKDNHPFLGICLGMQMMMEESEEFGVTKGLGIIPGKVVKIQDTTMDGQFQKVPHVGWNNLKCLCDTENSILNYITEQDSVYFVHSYTAVPSDAVYRLADTCYGGRMLSAVIGKGNCYGTQFHPEKSGKVGLSIISNFIKIEG